MERLTRRNSHGCVLVNYSQIKKQEGVNDRITVIVALSIKLAEYEDLDEKIGTDVYVTVSGKHYYRATLLGYGAYGKDKNHKTYCVMVHKESGRSFVDYFEKIFTKEEVDNMKNIMTFNEQKEYIDNKKARYMEQGLSEEIAEGYANADLTVYLDKNNLKLESD